MGLDSLIGILFLIVFLTCCFFAYKYQGKEGADAIIPVGMLVGMFLSAMIGIVIHPTVNNMLTCNCLPI